MNRRSLLKSTLALAGAGAVAPAASSDFITLPGHFIPSPWIVLNGGQYFIPKKGDTLWLKDFMESSVGVRFEHKLVDVYIGTGGCGGKETLLRKETLLTVV